MVGRRDEEKEMEDEGVEAVGGLSVLPYLPVMAKKPAVVGPPAGALGACALATTNSTTTSSLSNSSGGYAGRGQTQCRHTPDARSMRTSSSSSSSSSGGLAAVCLAVLWFFGALTLWFPVAAVAPPPRLSISAMYVHSCSLFAGRVKCWGSGGQGLTGYEDTVVRGNGPGEMGSHLPFVDLGDDFSCVGTLSSGANAQHTCAANGSTVGGGHFLKCWGVNAWGQLGYGDTADRGDNVGEMGENLTTVDLGSSPLVREIDAVVAGSWHTCAILGSRTKVKCWGRNNHGQLGLGDSSDRGNGAGQMGDALPFVDLGSSILIVHALSAGEFHTCAIVSNSSGTRVAKCWGFGDYGRLGQGDEVRRGDNAGEMGDSLPPLALGTGREPMQIGCGDDFTCVILDDGSLKCFGTNFNGELGYGDMAARGDGPGEMGDALPAVDLGTGRTAVSMSLGYRFSCVILDDASVKCFGENGVGQLGQGDMDARGDGAGEMGDSLLPVDVGPSSLGNVSIVTSGYQHACVAFESNDTSPKCWGDGLRLGLGDGLARGDQVGEMGSDLPFVTLGPSWNVSATCTATLTTFAPSLSPAPSAGPSAMPTQPPTSAPSPVPTPAPVLPPPLVISSMQLHSCSLFAGRVKCWGGGLDGRTGYEDSADRGDNPGEMGANLPFVDLGSDISCVSSLSRGPIADHTCVVNGSTVSGGGQSLKCWGYNSQGQLGYGDTNQRGDNVGEMGDGLPTVDLGSSPLVRQIDAVVVGSSHTCVLLGAHTLVKCWGANDQGHLGLGDTADRGDGAGEMGDVLPFVNLGSDNLTVHTLSAGEDHTCAIVSNSSGTRLAKCWGENDNGRLGQGDMADRGDNAGEMGDSLPPIALGTGREPMQIECGLEHTCVILDDDSLKCFGDNAFGQLGYGDVFSRGDNAGEMGDALPVVDLGTGRIAVSISSGFATCAVLDDASLKCWGWNINGELGQGDTDWRGDGAGEMGDALLPVDLGPSVGNLSLVSTGPNHVCAAFQSNETALKCWGSGNSGRLGLGNTNTRGDAAFEMGRYLPFVSLGPSWNAPAACLSTLTPPTPSSAPSPAPSVSPAPTVAPTAEPTLVPSSDPSQTPSAAPSQLPSTAPSGGPTIAPSSDPTQTPSAAPSQLPSTTPSGGPTIAPSSDPTQTPSFAPSAAPSIDPDVTAPHRLVISPMSSHSCSLFAGRVKCWGSGVEGRTGYEDTANRGYAPGEMGSNLPFVDLGADFSCVSTLIIGSHAQFTCAANGSNGAENQFIKCWGDNPFGELGYGDTVDRGDDVGEMGDALATVNLGSSPSVRQIDAIVGGAWHTCAILGARTKVKCWGRNNFGQLGLDDSAGRGDGAGEMGDALSFVDLGSNISTVHALSAGHRHTCAIMSNLTGTRMAKCWGDGDYGRLGQGDSDARGNNAGEMGDNLPPILLGTGREPMRIDCGEQHTCVVLDDGSLKCFGRNLNGQLGYEDKFDRGDNVGEMGDALPAVDLGTGRSAVSVSLGYLSTCALLDDASVKCFGWNNNGQLGQGDTSDRGDEAGEMGDSLLPVDLGPSVGNVISINSGLLHVCVTFQSNDSAPKCWGYGHLGLGDGATRGDNAAEMGRDLPFVNLGPSSNVSATCTGVQTTPAPSPTPSASPAPSSTPSMAPTRGPSSVPTLTPSSTPSLLPSAAPTAMPGVPSALPSQTPTQPPTGTPTAAPTPMPTAQPSSLASPAPTTVPTSAINSSQYNGARIVSLSAGQQHVCAVLHFPFVTRCWGYGVFGQLGTGRTESVGDDDGELGDNMTRVDLGTEQVASNVTCAEGTTGSHCCALLANRTRMKCWGFNVFGQLGQGHNAGVGDELSDMGDALPPVDLGYDYNDTSTILQLALGNGHTCALLDIQRIKCFGSSIFGQLGYEDTFFRGDGPGEMGSALPWVDLGTGRNATAIEAGEQHTCALLVGGDVKCWGLNADGQLGQEHANTLGSTTGSMGSSLPAIALGTSRSAWYLKSGAHHVCAILDNDDVKCWGRNSNGQLGYGDEEARGDGIGEMGDSLPAVNIVGSSGETVAGLGLGEDHSCALLTSGRVKCFGRNSNGQLGYGDTTGRGDDASEMGDSLSLVSLGEPAQSLSMAATASCALLADQSAKCWGRNSAGQLGQGHRDSLGDDPNEMGSSLSRIDVGRFQLPTQAPTAYPTASPTPAPSMAPTLSIETVLADNPLTSINIWGVGTDYVGLSWPAIHDTRMVVTGYRVTMQASGEGSFSTVSEPSTNWTIISSLQPSTLYRFKVAVVATRGVGTLSEETASTWTWNNTAGFFEDTGVFVRIVSSIPLPGCNASAILDASENINALFGSSNPSCSLINQRTARLHLAYGATLTPGTVVRVWTNETFAVSPPSNPTPVAASLSSAGHVSWCSSWVADASSTTGVGGSVYPLSYSWWVSSLDAGNAAAVAAENAELASTPSTTNRVLFNATRFAQDSIVTVHVTVSSSAFNLSDTTQADTNISAFKQPTVSIVGSANRTVLSYQDLSIRTSVSIPECFSGSSNSSIFSWFAVQGMMPATAFTAAKTLSIPALSLDVTQTYIFRVRMTLGDFPTLPAVTADVQVSTLLTPPVVALASGTQRTVECEANTTVDASQSYDPNVCSILESCAVLTFTWSCAGCSTSPSSDSITSHTDSIIEFAACDVANDTGNGTTLQLDVTAFSTVSGLFASEVVLLDVLQSSANVIIPDLHVQPVPESINPGDGLFVCTTDDVDLTLHEAGVASPPTLYSSRGSYFIVPTDGMVVGVLYAVSMTDVATGLATVTINVELNAPPSVGTMAVDPPTGGQAVLDSFRVESSGHVDDASDLPLSLTFSWTDDGGYESVMAARVAEFALDEVALPAGSSIKCTLVVSDRLGSAAQMEAAVASDVVVAQASSWAPTVAVLTDWTRPGAVSSALRTWEPNKSQYAEFSSLLLLTVLAYFESVPLSSSSDSAQSEFSSVHLMAQLALDTDQEEYPITVPDFEERILGLASPAFLGIRADALSQTTCDRALTITEATIAAQVETGLVFLSDVADSGCGKGVFAEAQQLQQALYVNLSAGCNVFVNNYRTDVSDTLYVTELREQAASCIAGFALNVSDAGIQQITASATAQGGVVEFVDTRSATLGAANVSSNNGSVLSDVHEIELRPSSLPCTQQCNSWEGTSNTTCTPLDVPANTSDLPAGAVRVTVSMDTLDKCGEIRDDLTCLHLQVEDLEAATESNSSSLVWNTYGCEVSDTTPTELTCSCNHLTAFAVGTLVGDGDDDAPCGKSQSQCDKLDSEWSEIYDHPGYAGWLGVLCVAWIVVLATDAQWFFDPDTKQQRSKFTLLVFISYATIVVAAVRIAYYMLMLVAYGTADNMACAEFGLEGSGSAITPYALFAVHDVFYPMLLTMYACVFLYWITLADLLETNMGRAQNVLFLEETTLHKVIAVDIVVLCYAVAVDTYLVVAADDSNSGTDTLARAHLALMASIFLIEAGMFIYARVQLGNAAQNKQTMAKVEFMSKVICGLFAIMGLVLLVIAAAPVTDHAGVALTLYSLLLPLLEIVTVYFLFSTLHQKKSDGGGWLPAKLQQCWQKLAPAGHGPATNDGTGDGADAGGARSPFVIKPRIPQPGGPVPVGGANRGGRAPQQQPQQHQGQPKSSVFHTVRSSPDAPDAGGDDVEMQGVSSPSASGPHHAAAGALAQRGMSSRRAHGGGGGPPIVRWETAGRQPPSQRGGPQQGAQRPAQTSQRRGNGFTAHNPMVRAPSSH